MLRVRYITSTINNRQTPILTWSFTFLESKQVTQLSTFCCKCWWSHLTWLVMLHNLEKQEICKLQLLLKRYTAVLTNSKHVQRTQKHTNKTQHSKSS